MEELQYITVKEFAERAGVSIQSVYKRLNQPDNNLVNYCKLIDNKKMLNIQALQDIYNIEVEKPVNQIQPEVVQPINQIDKPIKPDNSTEKLIELLEKQLEDKDRQIQRLQEEHEADRKKIDELDKRLFTLLDQEQKLRAMALVDQQETSKEADPEPDQQPEQAHKSIWERLKEFFN